MAKRKIIVTLLVVGALLLAYLAYALYSKLRLPAEGFELVVPPGSSLSKVTKHLHQQNILASPRIVRWYAVMRGYANNIRAGEYLLNSEINALELLDLLRAGKVQQHAFTIIEGQRVEDVIAALQRHPKIKVTLTGLNEAQINAKLGLHEKHLEGLLWPETYFFTAQTTDLDLLRRAHSTMQQHLHSMWEQRDPTVKFKTPYEAIILASIIEKESGVYAEFGEISGVYQRRLAQKMRLQADPTVIYAVRATLKGPLLTKHCKIDSQYNTYLYSGLPPTPIAVPSRRAIEAALHPATGEALYFVASGDGRHIFSKTLAEHNKAVAKVKAKLMHSLVSSK